MKPIKIGICGLGTVGGGTFNVLMRNKDLIAQRVGRPIEIAQIAMRRPNPGCDTSGVSVTDDVYAVADNPEIDILVELIGGCETAKTLVSRAIVSGKHVVTANKALIAVHGNELLAEAEKHKVQVAFEAAVAGGIPVIKALREGLAANKVHTVAGIINGTGNFILTAMEKKGSSFADVLSEAQALGYAEADPTFDVEGIDAAHKLTILASIAFGIPLQFEQTYTEGISGITAEDIQYAHELGYRIKHLGIARARKEGIELRVHPTLIPEKRLLANVDGVMNAVLVDTDAVGPTLFYGAGAGAEPTASAVIADIIDIARGIDSPHHMPALGYQRPLSNELTVLPMDETETAFYLRMSAADHPGVMTQITRILSEEGINIEALLQKEVFEGEQFAAIIMLTHKVKERAVNNAITAIEALDDVNGQVVKIRMDHLEHCNN
ncbi:homoserine dehydrogenase [Zooshikella ganghwensis]|uniref:Homoserine dehydrogenase n=1 Tax=Zooshikella ganghwensis TaxID=202772 RepID=A0A4P9VRQ3_9GAMM|nr:homoserine dehydrogenase [Zooshikella ganghwensis]RDH45094.1 homoserine dehydrogenase [Zooshikella ganghwensis]